MSQLPAGWEDARTRINALRPDQLLKWKQQLAQTVAISVAQAQRVGLGHLPGWHGTTGRPLLVLIEERLNQPFIS